jgi:hypothetical protein
MSSSRTWSSIKPVDNAMYEGPMMGINYGLTKFGSRTPSEPRFDAPRAALGGARAANTTS